MEIPPPSNLSWTFQDTAHDKEVISSDSTWVTDPASIASHNSETTEAVNAVLDWIVREQSGTGDAVQLSSTL